MKILAIGGTRFIGRAAVVRLVELGHTVTVFNRGKTQGELPAGVAQIMGDMNQLAEHHAAFEAFAPDVVVHNMIITEQNTRDLIDVFTDIAKRAIMISSMDVYLPFNQIYRTEGGDRVAYPMTEDSPLRTVWYPYRAFLKDESETRWWYDKIPSERLILNSKDLPGTVLRLPMVYGEHDYARRMTPFLKPMLDGRPGIVLSESYANWHSTYEYVENVAEATVLSILDERAVGRIYNIGGYTPSMLELANQVKAVVGWTGEIVVVPDADLPETLQEPYDYTAHLIATDARIRGELGYTPRVPTDEAIRRTVGWESETFDAETNYAEMLNYAGQDEVLAKLKT